VSIPTRHFSQRSLCSSHPGVSAAQVKHGRSPSHIQPHETTTTGTNQSSRSSWLTTFHPPRLGLNPSQGEGARCSRCPRFLPRRRSRSLSRRAGTHAIISSSPAVGQRRRCHHRRGLGLVRRPLAPATSPRMQMKPARARTWWRQGLTLVHYSAQHEPCPTQQNTLHTLSTPFTP
jgi:hypothetical protein